MNLNIFNMVSCRVFVGIAFSFVVVRSNSTVGATRPFDVTGHAAATQ